MMKGIDVSAWQGNINWDAVKASGIEFAIIRAGFGGNNIDKKFVRNIAECNRVGIPCGVYWFSYALSAAEAAQEAKYCIAAVKPYTLEFPVCFDLEYDTVRYAKQNGVSINKALATEMVKAFCIEVENAGYYAVNYTNQDYSRNMFDMEALSRFDLWYAWYNSECNRSDAGLWQFTSKGSVSGISGNVDMNYSNKDYPNNIRNAGLNGLSSKSEPQTEPTPAPTPTPAPALKSNDEIAKEVIVGKWGNGDERKQRLTQAGYDYSAIQNAVNSKCGASPAPDLKSTDEIAKEVIAGKWGNGSERKQKLTKAGYNYSAIQARVNELL